MKTLIAIVAVITLSLTFISCEVETLNEKNKRGTNFQKEYLIIEIDSCEYIMLYKNIHIDKAVGYLAHKGNCKNHIHIYNKK